MSTPTISPGDVLHCLECDVYEPVNGAESGDPCPLCEAEETEAQVAIPCPDPESCESDEHHFGLGVHLADKD